MLTENFFDSIVFETQGFSWREMQVCDEQAPYKFESEAVSHRLDDGFHTCLVLSVISNPKG